MEQTILETVTQLGPVAVICVCFALLLRKDVTEMAKKILDKVSLHNQAVEAAVDDLEERTTAVEERIAAIEVTVTKIEKTCDKLLDRALGGK